MALARSASGPGGLSINTSSANSIFGTGTTPAAGTMFGSTQPVKPATGLFGAASAPASGGLFGATSSAPPSGGLFGSNTTASQPASLFGSTVSSSQPQTASLFGPTPASQSSNISGSTATSQPSSLFGSTPAVSRPQTTSLFGSTAPSQPTSLFGSNLAATQPQISNLFGASQPQQTSSLFGSNTANQPQQTNSLFGATPAQNQTAGGLFCGQNTQNQSKLPFSFSLGGGLTMGQTTNQPPQTVPGVRIDTANIRSTTRFNDLHEDLQREIINIDKIIQAQIQLKHDCDAIMPSHHGQLSNIPHDVDFCQRKIAGVEDSIETDAESISHIRNLVKTDAENAKLSFRAVDNLKLPPQYHTSGIWSAKSANTDARSQGSSEEGTQDLVGFFSAAADELAATLSRYQNNITEIEQHLRGVEANSAQQINALIARRNGGYGAQENPAQELAGALSEFEQSILGVAVEVGAAREGVQSLQLGLVSSGNGRTTGKRRGIY